MVWEGSFLRSPLGKLFPFCFVGFFGRAMDFGLGNLLEWSGHKTLQK